MATKNEAFCVHCRTYVDPTDTKWCTNCQNYVCNDCHHGASGEFCDNCSAIEQGYTVDNPDYENTSPWDMWDEY